MFLEVFRGFSKALSETLSETLSELRVVLPLIVLPLETPAIFVSLTFRWDLKVFWEKKACTALLQCRTFLCPKKWRPQRKDFGARYGFPGFHRVFVSTTNLERKVFL